MKYPIEAGATIAARQSNTITLLFDKRNIMLISSNTAIAARPLQNDKLRRSLHADVQVEACRLEDSSQKLAVGGAFRRYRRQLP